MIGILLHLVLLIPCAATDKMLMGFFFFEENKGNQHIYVRFNQICCKKKKTKRKIEINGREKMCCEILI